MKQKGQEGKKSSRTAQALPYGKPFGCCYTIFVVEIVEITPISNLKSHPFFLFK